MTVRVVSFGVVKVSFMLKTREESILFSMISLAIVLKSTSTDSFPTAFRTHPILCAVRGTITGGDQASASTRRQLLLQRVIDIVARFMIYMRATGRPMRYIDAIHSTRWLSRSDDIADFVSRRRPSIGIPLCWSFTFLNNVHNRADDPSARPRRTIHRYALSPRHRRRLASRSARGCPPSAFFFLFRF